jgi:SAM-dependent methyltransferase
VTTDPVGRSFDLVAEDYAEQFFHELDGKPFDRERLEAFAARCPRDAPALEIGCGPGHVGRFVAARGPRVVGLDLSPVSARGARRLNPDLAFVAGDMRALPIRDGVAGALLAFYALIYFDAPTTAAILREYRRALRPGAPLLLAVHAGDGSERFTTFRGKAVDITLHYHQPAALAHAVARAGFERVTVETRVPYSFEHPTTRLYLSATATR